MSIRTEYIDVDFNLRLKKDLQEHEVICSHCGGTGLQVDNNPFGLKSENSKVHFPYKQQVIRGCNHCYTGVQKKCLHCDKILDRQHYQCDCDKAKQDRLQERYNKDLEIWNVAKKISLEESITKFDMVYVDNYDRYFFIDEFKEWLEDNEDNEGNPIDRNGLRIYGTHSIDLSIDASNVIEDACSELHEDAMDNISDEDQKELQTLLDKWCKDNQAGTTTYYADYKIGILL